MSVIHFAGGGRLYVAEDFGTVGERLRNNGMSRGFVDFTKAYADGVRERVAVNIALVSHYDERTDGVAT